MSGPRFLIGTSHKTYFTQQRAVAWATDVAAICRDHEAVTAGRVRAFVLPTHLAVPAVLSAVGEAPLAVGAQDVSAHEAGSHTGEVTAAELAEVGCALVAIGHAERRRDHGETDDVVAAKVAAALRHGLVPLICIGEQGAGSPEDAVAACRAQAVTALRQARTAGLSGEVVLAYEPVWAIGAESPASDEHIRTVCRGLREVLRQPGSTGGQDLADVVTIGRVVYGGSAGPGLLSRVAPDVDGLFLGRRAHDPAAVHDVLDEAVLAATGGDADE